MIICYDQRHSWINRLRLSMQLKDLSMTTVSCPLNCVDYYLLLCVNFLLYLRLSSKLKFKGTICVDCLRICLHSKPELKYLLNKPFTQRYSAWLRGRLLALPESSHKRDWDVFETQLILAVIVNRWDWETSTLLKLKSHLLDVSWEKSLDGFLNIIDYNNWV